MTNPYQPPGVTAAHNLMNYGPNTYSSTPSSYMQPANSQSSRDKTWLLNLLREVREEIMCAPAGSNNQNTKRKNFISILFSMCPDANMGRLINSHNFFYGFFSKAFFRIVSTVTGFSDIEACMSDNQLHEQATNQQQYNSVNVNTQGMDTNNYGQFQLSSRTGSNNTSASQGQQAQAWYRMPDERVKQREPLAETSQFNVPVNGYSVGSSAPATGCQQPYTNSGMYLQGTARVPPMDTYNHQYNTQPGPREEYSASHSQQRATSFQQAVPEQANQFGMLLPHRAQEQPVRPREGNPERFLLRSSPMSSAASGFPEVPYSYGSLQKSIDRQREVLSQATAKQRTSTHQQEIGYPPMPDQVHVSRRSSPPSSAIPIDHHNLQSHTPKPAQRESGSKRSRVKPDSKEHLKQLLAASKIAESNVCESPPSEPTSFPTEPARHASPSHANSNTKSVRDNVFHQTDDASSNNHIGSESENRTPSVLISSDHDAGSNEFASRDRSKTNSAQAPAETNHATEITNIAQILSMPILVTNAAGKENVCNTVTQKATDTPRSMGIYDPPLPIIKHKKREHRISPYKDTIDSDQSSNASSGSVDQQSETLLNSADLFRQGFAKFKANFNKESFTSRLSAKKVSKNNTREDISSSELEQTDLDSNSDKIKHKHRHKSAEVSSSSSPKSGDASSLTNVNPISKTSNESKSLKEMKQGGHDRHKMTKSLASHECSSKKDCNESSSLDASVDNVACTVSAREKVYSKWSGSRKLIAKNMDIVSKVRRKSHSGHGARVKARKTKRSASWNGPCHPVATALCQLGLTDELKSRSVSPDSTVLPDKHPSRLARNHSDLGQKDVADRDNLQLNKVSSQSACDPSSEMLYSDASLADSDDAPSDTETYVYADGSPIKRKLPGDDEDPLMLKKSKPSGDDSNHSCDISASRLELQSTLTEPDCPAAEESQYMQGVLNASREYILKSFVALRRQNQNLLDGNSKMKLDMISKDEEISILQKERDHFKEMLEKTFETYRYADELTEEIAGP